jgi:hypothetical protein
MDRLVKAPEDQFNFSISFDHDLETTETITGYAVYSGNRESGEASTATLIAATELTDQTIEVMLLGGQTQGEQHKITAVVYTDLNNVIEKDVAIDVLDIDIDHFYKQSAEEFKIAVDFGPLLDEGESLGADSIVIYALLEADLSDVTAATTGPSGIDADTGRQVELKVKGGNHDDFIMIGVQADCVNQILATTKRLRRIVNMSIIDDGYYGTIAWDYATSDDSIAVDGTAVVAIAGSGGPFTWAVTGTGYTLAESTTTGLTNQLNAASNACGDAEITVTNAFGDSATGTVAGPVNAVLWDDDTSDDTVLRNGSAVIAINGTCGPFTWAVTGTGFSMENPTTTGLTNQLNADGTACGVAEITVTNAQGLSATGYVRATYGSWVQIATGAGAVGYISGVGACIAFCGNQSATGAYGGTWELVVGKYKLREKWSFVELSLTCPVANEVEVEVAQPTDCGTLEPGWGGQGIFPCCVQGVYTPTRYAAFYLREGDKILYEWQC